MDMDYLSDQVCSDMKRIVDNIQEQHEKFADKCSEIEKLKKQLLLLNLSNILKNRSSEVSLVEVRVGNNLAELNEINDATFDDDTTLILIEILLSNSLHEILFETEFTITIIVSTGTESVSKTLPLESSEIKTIIPVKTCPLNCTVGVIFVGKIDEKQLHFKLSPVDVNVSHYFLPSNHEKENFKIDTLHEKIDKLNHVYDKRVGKNNYALKYKLTNLLISQERLMEKILRNCYTYFNFTNLIFDDKGDLNIRNKYLKTILTYKPDLKILQVEAQSFSLSCIKKYFIKELETDETHEKNKFRKIADFEINRENVKESYVMLRDCHQ